MAQRNKIYDNAWAVKRPWCNAVPDDPKLAHCSYCNINLKIDRGEFRLSKHEETYRHNYKRQKLGIYTLFIKKHGLRNHY